MGAQLWYHETPWNPDPASALQALQARFLRENYDLSAELPQHLRSARGALDAVKADGQRYEGLIELWEKQVQLLERVSKQALPEGAQAQIKILRRICAISGEGIGNVLDVTRVSKKRGNFTAQRLSPAAIARLVGTERPTVEQARQAIGKINEELHRGESVCFPVYDQARKEAVAWYFVGNTVD